MLKWLRYIQFIKKYLLKLKLDMNRVVSNGLKNPIHCSFSQVQKSNPNNSGTYLGLLISIFLLLRGAHFLGGLLVCHLRIFHSHFLIFLINLLFNFGNVAESTLTLRMFVWQRVYRLCRSAHQLLMAPVSNCGLVIYREWV